jgi:UDP-galactopyranose mutase
MEYSKEIGPGDIPYYPKRLLPDKKLLYKYRKEAETLEKISFLGRLATYRYMDMQYVIAEAIDLSKIFIESIKQGKKPPVFINKESAL